MLERYRSDRIVSLHDACLRLASWPADDAQARPLLPPDAAGADAWSWVLANHRFNCSLWNEEDLARRTRAADAEIAANKRNIDRFNQQRNDAMERIDDALLRLAGDAPRRPDARQSSETAGAMIDRMSILALKIHHMGLQTIRTDVDEPHRETCRARQRQLVVQRTDLAACYDRLLADIPAGTGYFRIYRQFKMYNDPDLNPALVAERQARPGR